MRPGETAHLPFTVLLDPCERGGRYKVQKVRDSAGNILALKQVEPGQRLQERREVLFHEAQILRSLRHRNIVRYRGLFEDTEGSPYLAMDWLKESLDDRASALHTTRHAMPFNQPYPQAATRSLLARLLEASEGVAYAHGHGVLHRDIKLANISLNPGKPAHMIDLGSACTMDEAGQIRGSYTPTLLSPEQAEMAECTTATDVYNFCATIHHGLTFPAQPHEAVIPGYAYPASVFTDFRPLREANTLVPKPLAKACAEGMHPDPTRRPPLAHVQRVLRDVITKMRS